MSIKLNVKDTVNKKVNFEKNILEQLEEFFMFVCEKEGYENEKFEDHFDDIVNQFIKNGISRDKAYKEYLKSTK